MLVFDNYGLVDGVNVSPTDFKDHLDMPVAEIFNIPLSSKTTRNNTYDVSINRCMTGIQMPNGLN